MPNIPAVGGTIAISAEVRFDSTYAVLDTYHEITVCERFADVNAARGRLKNGSVAESRLFQPAAP